VLQCRLPELRILDSDINHGEARSFAEEGNELETHDEDIPRRIRENRYKNKEKNEAQRKLERKALNILPITIRIRYPSYQDSVGNLEKKTAYRGLFVGCPGWG
jgi:hypothetical protein